MEVVVLGLSLNGEDLVGGVRSQEEQNYEGGVDVGLEELQEWEDGGGDVQEELQLDHEGQQKQAGEQQAELFGHSGNDYNL